MERDTFLNAPTELHSYNNLVKELLPMKPQSADAPIKFQSVFESVKRYHVPDR